MARDAVEEESVALGGMTGSLGFLLRMAQLQSFRAFYDMLSRHDLKPGEFTVLRVIETNPGLRQGTVAATLAIKPAHMTKLVGRMVDRGLVTRTVPQDDRRSVRLSLTDAGAAFLERHRAAFREFEAAERGPLNDEESAELTRLLQKLTGLEGNS